MYTYTYVQVVLKQCIKHWIQDQTCQKLAIVLEDGASMVDQKGALCCTGFKSKRDQNLVSTLMSCKYLDVGFAGMFVCMCPRAYVPLIV